jgi:CheY-like chemotaxis protein
MANPQDSTTAGSGHAQHPLTRHVVIAAHRTPAWTELAHGLLADGIEYAWIAPGTTPEEIPSQLPPPPTVVIVDLTSDASRGLAIVTECRQSAPAVPLVVVAANPSIDFTRRMRLAGVFYLALDPVTADEVRTILGNAFDCLARARPGTSTCRAKRRILIVDDDADYVASLTALLESRGYSVASARSGKEGLEKVRAETPDLIVLDVMMEYDSSGYEVNQAVKFTASFEGFRHVPIIMVSSIPLDPPTRFQMAGDVDMITPNRYMTKPIDIPRFLATVRALLGESEPVPA